MPAIQLVRMMAITMLKKWWFLTVRFICTGEGDWSRDQFLVTGLWKVADDQKFCYRVESLYTDANKQPWRPRMVARSTMKSAELFAAIKFWQLMCFEKTLPEIQEGMDIDGED